MQSSMWEYISKRTLVLLIIANLSICATLGIVGFKYGNVGERLVQSLHEFERMDIGRGGSLEYIVTSTGEKVIYVDVGVDMKAVLNESVGVVYWYRNVELPYGATALDALMNVDKAEYLELREYELDNPQNWWIGPRLNASEYKLVVETAETAGVVHVVAINGVRNNPGQMKEWQFFWWDPEQGVFQYAPLPESEFKLGNRDSIVFIYEEFGGYPLPCCTGSGGWEYEAKTAPGGGSGG